MVSSIKFKKIGLLFFVMSFFTLIFLSSCSNKYGAKIYSKINNNINENIFDEYKIKGASYYNDEDKLYFVDDAPEYRLFVINSNDEYVKYFKDDIITADYEKEIIYLYMFCDMYTREYTISSISKKKEQLKINVRLKSNGNRKDAVQPYARVIAVKMKKIDVYEVIFNAGY